MFEIIDCFQKSIYKCDVSSLYIWKLINKIIKYKPITLVRASFAP